MLFWRVAIMVGRWTGQRMMEIAGLEWKSFTKTGIVVPFSGRGATLALRIGKEILNRDAVKDALALIPATDEKWCFPVQRETNHSTLSTYLKRMCVAAGVKGRSFQDLRVRYLAGLV